MRWFDKGNSVNESSDVPQRNPLKRRSLLMAVALVLLPLSIETQLFGQPVVDRHGNVVPPVYFEDPQLKAVVEEELGISYEVLDGVIEALHENRGSGDHGDVFTKVKALVETSCHKRAAPDVCILGDLSGTADCSGADTPASVEEV